MILFVSPFVVIRSEPQSASGRPDKNVARFGPKAMMSVEHGNITYTHMFFFVSVSFFVLFTLNVFYLDALPEDLSLSQMAMDLYLPNDFGNLILFAFS